MFFCDTDSHNSMLTGAFMCAGAKVQIFKHNDLSDLEYKLRRYKERAPEFMICVAVEGVYRLVDESYARFMSPSVLLWHT